MSMFSKFYKSLASYYVSLQQQYSIAYLKEILIGLLLAVILVGGYFLNRLYVNNREEKAFVALSEIVESFSQAQRASQFLDPIKDEEKIKQAWQDTEILIDALHKDNVNSYLAPYFMIYKSQLVLLRDKNLQEAIKLLDEALTQIPKSSAMGSLYRIKRIKMGLDSQDQEMQTQALQNLIEISNDSDDYAYEEAMYLLGVYYLSQQNSEKFQETFQKLIDSADASALIPSPWVKLAREKMGMMRQSLAE